MRNILKKSTAILLVGALSVSLVACDSKKVGKKEEKKITKDELKENFENSLNNVDKEIKSGTIKVGAELDAELLGNEIKAKVENLDAFNIEDQMYRVDFEYNLEAMDEKESGLYDSYYVLNDNLLKVYYQKDDNDWTFDEITMAEVIEKTGLEDVTKRCVESFKDKSYVKEISSILDYIGEKVEKDGDNYVVKGKYNLSSIKELLNEFSKEDITKEGIVDLIEANDYEKYLKELDLSTEDVADFLIGVQKNIPEICEYIPDADYEVSFGFDNKSFNLVDITVKILDDKVDIAGAQIKLNTCKLYFNFTDVNNTSVILSDEALSAE